MRTRAGRRVSCASAAVLLALFAGCAGLPGGTTGLAGGATGAPDRAHAGASAAAGTRAGRGALIAPDAAAAGGTAGKYLDQQAAEWTRRIPEAAVARQGERLYVALPSGMLFDGGGDRLLPEAAGILRTAAEVLVRYPDTLVTVEGHTDSTGTHPRNRLSSERRASRVRDVLAGHGVPPERMNVYGYGETDPVADNSTPEGRRLNRRIQLEIRPDGNLEGSRARGG